MNELLNGQSADGPGTELEVLLEAAQVAAAEVLDPSPAGGVCVFLARPVPILLEVLAAVLPEQRLLDAGWKFAADAGRPFLLVLPGGAVVVAGEQDDVMQVAGRVANGAGVDLAFGELRDGDLFHGSLSGSCISGWSVTHLVLRDGSAGKRSDGFGAVGGALDAGLAGRHRLPMR